mmetsp:Transcript_20233/g.31135  ORF Transcript_20233/g.31135 Transcript_20233/m.31135 type:complete len:88 (-) Transcript_20233:899-1162(-)
MICKRKREEIVVPTSGMVMNNANDGLLDLTVEEALDKVMVCKMIQQLMPKLQLQLVHHPTSSYQQCPALYFSGVTNTEIMDAYNHCQ